MSRAQVCLISSSKSGERHLYLIKVSRDKISDNDDQETANCDAKGNKSQIVYLKQNNKVNSIVLKNDRNVTILHAKSMQFMLTLLYF